MEKIYIGYVQGVHGLRGDLKIKNRFENPDAVFKNGNTIYLDDGKHIITNSKFYKGFYLVTIDNLKDINKVEKYIGSEVYFDREDLHLQVGEFILDDLYSCKIDCDGENLGCVKEIFDNGIYKILVIDYDKEYMIPFIDEYIESVEIENHTIKVSASVRGLIL